MFEKFTENGRKAFAIANREAQRFHHEGVETEHVLLGLIKEGESVTLKIFKALDVDLKKLKLQCEKVGQAADEEGDVEKMPQSPQIQHVVKYAVEEARQLKHSVVGSEHILLGLIRETDGAASTILIKQGVTLESVRDVIIKLCPHAETV
jgi:ATP-dependent Clp protease ATP-binding subunit ClpC